MYRVTSITCRSRNILYQRPSTKTRVASLSLTPTRASYSAQERDECPPPPRQPPPPPVPWKLKFTVLAVSVLTTYCTIYAKKSPEARDWLSIHAPWFDDFIAVVYEENMTHKQFIQKCIDDLRDYKERPRPCSTDSADCVQDAPLRERIECPEQPIVTNKEGKECSMPPPPVITTDVCELEECLREHGDGAYFGYMTARDACKYYNDLVAAAMTDFCVHRFDELGPAGEERQELVGEHAASADDAWASLNSLEKYLDCGGMKGTKEQIENTKLLFNEYQAKIKNMHADYAWEADRAGAVQNKVEMVKELLDKYMEENQTMLPSVDYKSKKPQISEDIDLFLIHSLKYMKKLRPILEEYAEAISLRADRGVESLPVPAEDWEKRQRAQIIPNKFKEKQWELELDYRKRLDNLKAYNDKVLKESLKNQNDRHQESFKVKMETVEREATARLNKMVANAVAAQKKVFNAELAEMGAKLKEVEKRLQARLKADRELKRSKDLYAAGSSLLAATKKGEAKVNVTEELKALEKAAGNDDALVLTVLKSIPQGVRKEGLVPESVLRDRYHSMEQVALRVALVEDEGAPLPIYMMSYVQSLLLFMKLPGIPQEDVDKPLRENMDDLDTFDILRRARYWIQQGNMAAALRYVSSLEGASRAAAARWRDDAESLVATRQAAEAVLAHATALGLQYV